MSSSHIVSAGTACSFMGFMCLFGIFSELCDHQCVKGPLYDTASDIIGVDCRAGL